MSAETIIKALSLGEGASTDEVITLEFAGRTWHVKGFIGAWPKAVLMIEGESALVDPADIVTTLLRSACVVMAGTNGSRRHARRVLLYVLGEEFDLVSEHIADLKSGRGKPS